MKQEAIPFMLKLDAINRGIGNCLSYLTIIMVLCTFINTVSRYLFDEYSVAVAEAVMIMNALVFMLGAAWTLLSNHHVRVDVIYSHLSIRKKALCDLIGTIFFLIPFCLFVMIYSYDYVSSAWAVREPSAAIGGLPGLYLVKTIIPVMAGLLLFQAMIEIYKSLILLWR